MKEQNTPTDTTLETPIQYASFGRRLSAYFVDLGIVFLIGMMLQTMLGQNPLLSLMKAQSLEEIQQYQTSTSGNLSLLINLIFGLSFYLIFWVNYNGATPGKKLMAIKIVKDDSSKLTYPVAFIRYIGILVSSFFLGLGYLWVIWDKKKQAWHDKIAGTIVIKTEAKPKTILALFLSALTIIFYSFFIGIVLYRTFELTSQQRNRIDSNKEIKESLQSIKDDVPENNPHWIKAQELFGQLKSSDLTDTENIKQIDSQIVEELKMVLEENPDNPRVWVELGHALGWVTKLDNKLAEEGLKAYQKAEELDPKNPIYIEYVADRLMMLGRYDETVLQLQKSLRLNPGGSAWTNFRLARAYRMLNMLDLSKEYYQKAINLFMESNGSGQWDDEILQSRKELTEVSK